MSHFNIVVILHQIAFYAYVYDWVMCKYDLRQFTSIRNRMFEPHNHVEYNQLDPMS